MHIIEDEKDKAITADKPEAEISEEKPAGEREAKGKAKSAASDAGGGSTGASSSGTLSEKERERVYEEYKNMMRRNAFPNWIDILAMVGIIIGALFAAFAVVGIIGIFVKEPDKELLNLVSYVVWLGAAILFIIILQRHRGMKTNLLHSKFSRMNPILLLWGVVLLFVTGVVIEPLFDLFPSKYLDQLDSAIGQGGWAILQVVILAPVLEEILFRGLILGSIRQKSGKALGAVFISAAIFGAMHVPIPQQMVNAFVIGLILGYIYVKTESLAAVIIIHAINNGLAYVLRELFGSSANAVSTKEMIGNDTVYYIIYGICLVMLVVSFVMMIRAMARGQAVPEGEITGETAVSGVGNGKSQENEKTSAPENNNKV